MSRLPAVPDRSRFSGEELEAFDAVAERVAGVTTGGHAYYGAMLNSPMFAAALSNMGRTVRTKGSYTPAQREWVDMVLSRDFDYTGVLLHHVPDALAVGVRLEGIEAILAGRDDDLDDEERELATYTRQVVSGTVTDESWQAIHDRLGLEATIEYTTFILFLQLVLRLHQALDVPQAPPEELEKMMRDFRDGTRALPDPAAGLR